MVKPYTPVRHVELHGEGHTKPMSVTGRIALEGSTGKVLRLASLWSGCLLGLGLVRVSVHRE